MGGWTSLGFEESDDLDLLRLRCFFAGAFEGGIELVLLTGGDLFSFLALSALICFGAKLGDE